MTAPPVEIMECPAVPFDNLRLRIGVIAPPWFAVPPSGYGGIEAMLAGLVDGLVARGHEVVLVGAGSAGTRAQSFHAVYDEPPSIRLGDPMPEVVQAAAASQLLSGVDLDVVHDHTLAGPLLAGGRAVPTVVTAHGPMAGEPGDYLAHLGNMVSVVAISLAQRRVRHDINWVATVYNGIDVRTFPFGQGDGGYLLFIGRFNPDKGAHLAIDAARRAGRRLVLAGKCNEPAEKKYFAEAIAPRLGSGIDYMGEADALTKRQLYAGAEALLFPVCWDEPFGLVMVEAMACGTPVVAFRRGSVPEVVDDGRTGILVDEPDLFAKAVVKAAELDRHECRTRALEFDISKMVDGYETVYYMLAKTRELSVQSVQGSRSQAARAQTQRRQTETKLPRS